MTDETRYQKAFMFVGPKRGGRGTIGRVLRGLLGKSSYLGTSMTTFKNDFGMQSFIGKKVVVFSDARMDGIPWQSQALVAERMLTITGEDSVDINRKGIGYWSGTLGCRLVIFSNELLKFKDESGALANSVHHLAHDE